MMRDIWRRTALAAFVAGSVVRPATAAEPAAGKEVFQQCAACHSVEKGVNKVGPSLYGVVGRRPGALDTYDYSKWMVRFGKEHVWDEDTLIAYLGSPQRVVIGTKMPFPGLPDRDDRANVVDYLKSIPE